MKRFPKAKQLDYSTSRSAARNGRTLGDWVRLARRNPGAVPANVQRTIARRHPRLAAELGYN